ncbi:MAG: type II toxin-antitoxin system RelE/ParE family toxin [Gammaproteobacteria bacterium]|nr:type II toxin-antitoxin system RelE/ParE family toxin [Gammaproteobacteria bacterium]
MAWSVEFSNAAVKALKKIDHKEAERIIRFLHERIEPADDPRLLGKALQGELRTYWRYRVGHYRLICHIDDSAVRVLVVRIAHRKEIYR